ncbi:hypothetical protein ORF20 [Aviadenovirus bubonis]|nr:hypothetical protein ORF20 [Owl adenovirus]
MRVYLWWAFVLQELVAVARGCGFQNECGVIWFSLLVPREQIVEEVHATTQLNLTRAVSQMNFFSSERMYRVHESLSSVICCRCVRAIRLKSGDFYIVNCIIRLQSSMQLYLDEKDETLRVISRRLFFIPPTVEEKCRQWLINKGKYSDYKFLTTGLMIRYSASLKMALRSMSYEVSNTSVPREIPFYKAPVLFLNACRSVLSAGIVVRSVGYSSAVTQPVFLRSMLKAVCSEKYWGIVSRGLCYMVGFREVCTGLCEQWTFHVHGSYGEPHTCSDSCKGCKLRQPLTLFNLAQFACIRNMFLQRRAHVTHSRSSVFF